MERYKWLSISLFCHSAHQHLLLTQGVRPIVNKLKADGLLTKWCFDFNGNCGSNISFPVLVKSIDAQNTAEIINNHFLSFFLKAKFKSPANIHPINDLYKPFPVNSIQFGLYHIQDMFAYSNMELKQILSEIFIEAVCDEAIDANSLLSFSVYLHFIFFREVFILNRNQGKLQEFFIEISRNLKLDKDTKIELDELFYGVIDDINHTSACFQNFPWLIRWENYCKSNSDIEDPLIIFKFINQHLQLTPQLLEFVCNLTAKYIELLSNTNAK